MSLDLGHVFPVERRESGISIVQGSERLRGCQLRWLHSLIPLGKRLKCAGSGGGEEVCETLLKLFYEAVCVEGESHLLSPLQTRHPTPIP